MVIFCAEKEFSLCLNVFLGYLVLMVSRDAFWQMIWGKYIYLKFFYMVLHRCDSRCSTYISFCGYYLLNLYLLSFFKILQIGEDFTINYFAVYTASAGL